MVQRLLDAEYEKRVTLCQDLIGKVESDEIFFIKVHFFYLTFIWDRPLHFTKKMSLTYNN